MTGETLIESNGRKWGIFKVPIRAFEDNLHPDIPKIPSGGFVRDLHYDYATHSVWIRFYHPDLSEVPEGELIPAYLPKGIYDAESDTSTPYWPEDWMTSCKQDN